MFTTRPFATTTRVFPHPAEARHSRKVLAFQTEDTGVVPEGQGTDQVGDRARALAIQSFGPGEGRDPASEVVHVAAVTVQLFAPWWRRRTRHPLTFRYLVTGATYRSEDAS